MFSAPVSVDRRTVDVDAVCLRVVSSGPCVTLDTWAYGTRTFAAWELAPASSALVKGFDVRLRCLANTTSTTAVPWIRVPANQRTAPLHVGCAHGDTFFVEVRSVSRTGVPSGEVRSPALLLQSPLTQSSVPVGSSALGVSVVTQSGLVAKGNVTVTVFPALVMGNSSLTKPELSVCPIQASTGTPAGVCVAINPDAPSLSVQVSSGDVVLQPHMFIVGSTCP